MDYRARYQRLATAYDAIDAAELLYKRRVRARALSGLRGRILDAGTGTGRNLPAMPEGARVVGIDASAGMLPIARARAAHAGRPCPLAAMDILALGFPDGTFDAVVAAFVLSSLSEDLQVPALKELGRVCRPGGEIRILDYRLTDRPLWRLGMRLWSIWEAAVYGCSFERHTERHLAAAGLKPVTESYLVGDFVRLLVARPAL